MGILTKTSYQDRSENRREGDIIGHKVDFFVFLGFSFIETKVGIIGLHVSHPHNVRYKRSYREMSNAAGSCYGSVLCGAGNRTPASHLTGFLHTLGSVFELSHQILEREKKKKQHTLKVFNRNNVDEGDLGIISIPVSI